MSRPFSRCAIVALATLCCSAPVGCGPPPVVRPVVGDSPITVVPPTPNEATREPLPPPPELDHTDHVRALLAEIEDPVRVRVFARPLEGDATTDELARVCRGMLSLSEGLTRFDMGDPLATPDSAREARILGVVPLGTTPGSRRRRDPLPEDGQYRAVVIAIGNELMVVPQITADRGDLEFQMAEAISRMLHGARLVGLVTSEERDEQLSKLRRVLDRLDVRPVSLDEELPDDLSALLVVGPGKRLTRPQVKRLRRFLGQGGSAGLLLDGMKVEEGQNRYRVTKAPSGLKRLLRNYGITVGRDLVFDHRCGRVSVPARVGRMFLPYPPIPTAEVVQGQVMTPDARTVRLPFPSSLELSEQSGSRVTPLLRTSESGWIVSSNYDLSPFQQWRPPSDAGSIVLGAAVQHRRGTRLAVVANARFVEDNYLTVSDNALFVRQLVEWLGGHRALTRMIESSSQPPSE